MNRAVFEELISTFLEKGYRFVKFDEFNENLNSQIILRHDVDFCVQHAFEMADLEYSLGVSSTYYFLLSSDSYNLLSDKNVKAVNNILAMGHSIGLHFDPTPYEDEYTGFERELKFFEDTFGPMSSMSFHRPSDKILEGVDWLPSQLIGAYQNKYFKEIAYISDSGGSFRFGHPFDHKAFIGKQNIQLLIHPIWWMTKEINVIDKIKGFLTHLPLHRGRKGIFEYF